MYSTTWCGYCLRLKAQMERENIPFTIVDIERDASAAAFVEHNNHGNRTVPTVLFPDGSVLTNPPIGAVRARMHP
ncbi:MAG: NrdH-redoxin [Actinobacteria bacterium]|nr:NrdH-redoxin [Actinomycetota bacterium]MCB9413442.1 NrdH-redoxin [Actinomycetota bacterium]